MCSQIQIDVASEEETEALAARIARTLMPGDTLLLDGPIGAGKSALSRAVIRAALGNPLEEVPSPTFTLVQTYHAPEYEIWHCDLYRLSSPDELVELGLDDAFDTAVCLIEWPDRLGSDAPEGATRVNIEPIGDTSRRLHLTGTKRWIAGLAP